MLNIQSARNILLIRPQNFGYNPETAKSNEFQNKVDDAEGNAIKEQALGEFDRFVETLRSKGVGVFVFDDANEPAKPDAIFPNNWVSFHADGTVILYPMCVESRRSERRMDIVEALGKEFRVEKIIDLSHYENENRFLEGTGSIVFDHVNKTAYACISARTDTEIFAEVSQKLGYAPVSFHAVDAKGRAIYHTNVMMCIGPGFGVICLESIEDQEEKDRVSGSLKANGLEIVDIGFEQMNRFAGNMLAVANEDGKRFLVLSTNALDSLTQEQITILEQYCELLPVAIPTIERVGGGGARCMMAEVFLPKLNISSMAAKITAFLITMITSIAAGVVIFFFMLLAMNGYGDSDAMWGLIAYVLLAFMVVILSSTGALLLVGSLTKRQFSPVVCVPIALAVFSIVSTGLELVCGLIGVGVAELVRIKF